MESSESIKHLLFREEPEEIKYPMYRSQLSKFIREDVKRKKHCHRTMGFPHDFPRTPPENFLKKRTRMVRRPVVEVPKPSARGTMPVPKRKDWYVPPERPPVNFITKNIRDAINSVPKSGPYRDYDTAFCRRVKHRVYCIPVFVKKEGYGKVPEYISKRKKKIEKEKLLIEQEMEKQIEEPPFRLIPPEERKKLLDGLKNTWAEMQKEFQLLPMLNDTPPQIKRKEKLERDLAELENDIKLVELNQHIYVWNPNKVAKYKSKYDPCAPKLIC